MYPSPSVFSMLLPLNNLLTENLPSLLTFSCVYSKVAISFLTESEIETKYIRPQSLFCPHHIVSNWWNSSVFDIRKDFLKICQVNPCHRYPMEILRTLHIFKYPKEFFWLYIQLTSRRAILKFLKTREKGKEVSI